MIIEVRQTYKKSELDIFGKWKKHLSLYQDWGITQTCLI